MLNPKPANLESINYEFKDSPITKDMLLELALQVRKDSKEFLEVGKQFCEWIKSRS